MVGEQPTEATMETTITTPSFAGYEETKEDIGTSTSNMPTSTDAPVERFGNGVASDKSQQKKYYNVGKDFYDTYDNEDDKSEHSIHDQLDFSSRTVRISRQEENLTTLHKAYAKVLQIEEDNNTIEINERLSVVSNTTCTTIDEETTVITPETTVTSSAAGPSSTSSICVMIEGLSGTGKSTLFQLFTKQLRDEHHRQKQNQRKKVANPIIMSGKFEEFCKGDPMSAIVHALGGLSEALLDTVDEEEFLKIRKHINKQLGNQTVQDLLSILPCLRPLLDSSMPMNTILDMHSSTHGDENGVHKHDSVDGDDSIAALNITSITTNPEENHSDHELQSIHHHHCDAININTSTEHARNRMKYMIKALLTAVSNSGTSDVLATNVTDSPANASNVDSSSSDTKQQIQPQQDPEKRPIILFLDDLQWCDTASLELLESLLLDKDVKHFLFIGAYRSDEGVCSTSDANHVLLRKLIKGLEQRTKGPPQSNNLMFYKIKTENLSLDELEGFLKMVLNVEEGYGNEIEGGPCDSFGAGDNFQSKRVHELAATLHPKTLGNILFTRELLEELHANGNLTFSRVTFMWEWDLEQLELSENVLQAVTQRIQNNTSKLLQTLLTTAAYMRSTVDVDYLKVMMDMEGTYMLSREDIVKELDKAVTFGFLTNVMGSSQYTFAHDRIQQAAYQLIPEGKERDEFRFSIGTRLHSLSMNKRFKKLNDWMLFSAADHFNATFTKNPLFLTLVNLQAGKKCISVAAFENASKYFTFGLKSFSQIENAWEKHYKTALDLHECIVQSELLQGHIEMGQELAEAIFENARNLNDKLTTKLALARALGQRQAGRKASFELSKATLQSMGMYPKTLSGIYVKLVRDLLYVRQYFKTHSDPEILALPLSNDRYQDIGVELYVNTLYQGWFTRNVVEFLAATLKCLRKTFRHGLSPHSGVGFMAYFMFCDYLGDNEGAHRFANLGLQVLSHCQNNASQSLQIFTKALYLDAWSTNTKEVANLYEEGVKSGMESGNFESAFMCRGARIHHEFMAGRPLALLDIQYLDLVEKENAYSLGSNRRVSMQQWLIIRCLRHGGDGLKSTHDIPMPPFSSSNHSNLNFDAIFSLDEEMSTNGPDNYPKIYCFSSRLQIAVYWGNYKFAEDLIEEKSVSMNDRSLSTMALRLFFLSLACGGVYCKTRRRQYLQRSRAAAAKLKSVSQAKGLNSWHRYAIASAHLKGCISAIKYKSQRRKRSSSSNLKNDDSSSSAVLRKYEKALELAKKHHHFQDVALTAQLAAEYLMQVDEADTAAIGKYLMLAKENYRNWGATSLVHHLEETYASYFADATSRETSLS